MRVIRMAEEILIETESHDVYFSSQDYIWILGEKTKSELMSLCEMTILDGQPLMKKLLGIDISNDKLHEPYGICLVHKRSYMRANSEEKENVKNE